MTSKEKLETIKKSILNWDEKEIKWFDDILKDLEILEIFRNSGYFVSDNGDDDFRLTFGVHSDDVDAFIEWKTGKKKKTLF